MENASSDTSLASIVLQGNFSNERPQVSSRLSVDLAVVRLACNVVLSLPISILGIVGNIMAFVVLRKLYRQFTTAILLQALAVADTLVLLTVVLKTLRYVQSPALNEIYAHIFLAIYPCMFVFRLLDMWLTVLLTIDRYIVICLSEPRRKALGTPRRTYWAIIAASVASVLFSLPRFFEFEYNSTHNAYMATPLAKNKGYVIGYSVVLFFIVMYLVPTLLLVLLNSRLLCALKRNPAPRGHGQSEGSDGNGGHRSLTSIIIAVVIMCVTCNMAAMVAHTLYAIEIRFRGMPRHDLDVSRRIFTNLSNLLITINCATNFLIYCCLSARFRQGFAHLCPCVRRRKAETETNEDTDVDRLTTIKASTKV